VQFDPLAATWWSFNLLLSTVEVHGTRLFFEVAFTSASRISRLFLGMLLARTLISSLCVRSCSLARSFVCKWRELSEKPENRASAI